MDRNTKTIDIYKAVDEMKRISAEGGTFAIRFRKYNRATGRGGDMAHIAAARLVENSSHKLFITDTETGRPLTCWQGLVMEVNGLRTTV